jgi:hypothetical protein
LHERRDWVNGIALDVLRAAIEDREAALLFAQGRAEGLRRDLAGQEARIADLESQIAELRSATPDPAPPDLGDFPFAVHASAGLGYGKDHLLAAVGFRTLCGLATAEHTQSETPIRPTDFFCSTCRRLAAIRPYRRAV